MRVLVLGCGSIGRRHIANLIRMGHRVVAFDPDMSRATWAEQKLGCAIIADVAEGLDAKPDAVWVCTPPHLHRSGADQAIKRRIPCFVEKPLAATAEDAAAIAKTAAAARVPVAVGYQLRVHPALRLIKAGIERGTWGRLLSLRAEMGQYLPDWRPWQDYRRSYTAMRRQGGGILLDGSHEIDLVRWLAGDVLEVFCWAGKRSGLEIDVEDTAALVLRFKSGVVGEVHLDMVQRAYRRNLELVFENATVIWDHPSAELKTWLARSRGWRTRMVRTDSNDSYLRESREFLRSIRDPGGSPSRVVSAADAARTMGVVAAALRSSQSARMEPIR